LNVKSQELNFVQASKAGGMLRYDCYFIQSPLQHFFSANYYDLFHPDDSRVIAYFWQ